MSDLVDIVILWVDGSDKKWIEKKKFWQKKYGIINNCEERYRNWDNLQYLFRGIEKYASWVNHIFLVTDDQKPEWLDENHSKVTVIDHTQIIDKEFLPTFNTHAIELNIHRIEQLSENFIYFNDDTFIIDNIFKGDFFEKGIPKDEAFLDKAFLRKGKFNENEPIENYIRNNLKLINDSFDKYKVIKTQPLAWLHFKGGKKAVKHFLSLPFKKFTGFFNPHLCIAYNKSTFDTIWKKYSKELLKTTKSKFREDDNYNVWLMKYWQLVSNNFSPRKNSLGKFFGVTDQNVEECASYIKKQGGKVVCINDNEYLLDFNKAKQVINNELLYLFPNKSNFEK